MIIVSPTIAGVGEVITLNHSTTRTRDDLDHLVLLISTFPNIFQIFHVICRGRATHWARPALQETKRQCDGQNGGVPQDEYQSADGRAV